MRFRPRLKTVVLGVGMALAAGSVYAGPWGAPSQGDSGYGVDTVLGNGFNPRGLDTTLTKDPNGLGPFRSPVSHTPTGQMYSVPWAEPEEGNLHGSIEFGYISTMGDENAAKLREYRDMSDGFTINNFNVSGESATTHNYFKLFGGSVGRDDQYYGAEVGCYNCWRVRFFYNQTPHLFSSTARPIWDGVGTDNLRLKQGLQYTANAGTPVPGSPGGATNATREVVRGIVVNTPDTDIELIRKKGGLRFDTNITKDINVFASFNREKRTGSRTFGLAPNGPGGAGSNAGGAITPNAANGPIENPEPINYTTDEYAAGMGWNIDALSSLVVRVEASIFRDAYSLVKVEDPYFSPTPTTNRHTLSYTTPPDNEAYTIRADYQRAFPSFYNSNFNATASWSRQNQDDALVPYTTATGEINAAGTPAALNAANSFVDINNGIYWNQMYATVNGVVLPTTTRQNSDLHNDIGLVSLGFSMQPIEALSLNAKLRFYSKADTNTYISCNPALAAAKGAASGVTGSCDPALNHPSVLVYGQAVEDNAPGLGSQYQQGGGNGVRERSFSGTYRQRNGGLTADYKLNKMISLNASYEREDIYREMRERDWTFEDKFKFGVVARKLFNGTLRASYEYDNRDGTVYKPYGYTASCAAAETNIVACANNLSNVDPTGVPLTQAQLAVNSQPGSTSRNPEGTKHDINDRVQHILVARYNLMLTNTLDAMVTARHKMALYPNPGTFPTGRDGDRGETASVEVNWQPTVATSLFGYYTYQETGLQVNNARNFGSNCPLVNLAALNCTAVLGGPNSIFGTPVAGAAIFRFEENIKDHTFGVGGSHFFGNLKFDGTYQFTQNRTSTKYVNAPFVVGNGFVVTTGGPFDFPDYKYDRHQLNLNATFPIAANAAIRVTYMYDHLDFADWHYNDLVNAGAAVSGPRYYLDAGPAQPYTAHTIGAFLQYKM